LLAHFSFFFLSCNLPHLLKTHKMKVFLTASTLAVALVGTATANDCDPNDWVNNATTNHFTADCSGAVNPDDPCLVTMATGYFGGEVEMCRSNYAFRIYDRN
jgi:hypothetical protein